MVSISHLVGAIKYPIIAGGTIYLRYKHLDQRVTPLSLANSFLWLCFTIMLALASYVVYVKWFI